MIVARYEVPGISKIGDPCRRYGVIRSVRVSSQIVRVPELTLESPMVCQSDWGKGSSCPFLRRPPGYGGQAGTGSFCMAFPGTTYLATITLSLRDEIRQPPGLSSFGRFAALGILPP
jgi:hypothetical protein